MNLPFERCQPFVSGFKCYLGAILEYNMQFLPASLKNDNFSFYRYMTILLSKYRTGKTIELVAFSEPTPFARFYPPALLHQARNHDVTVN